MINKSPPFKGLNIKIPIMVPIEGRGLINHEFGLVPTKLSGPLPCLLGSEDGVVTYLLPVAGGFLDD